MFNPVRRALCAAALVMAFVALPLAPAMAASSAPWKVVDVTAHTEPNGSIMLISGELPASVKLPATVELAVPAGAKVQWAGEILGGAPESDPAVKTAVEKRGAIDVHRFTLTRARIGQIEVVAPELVKPAGAGFASALRWTPSQATPSVRLAVRLPDSSGVTSRTVGAVISPGPQGSGMQYVTQTFTNVPAGRPVGIDVAWAAGAPLTRSAPTPPPADNTTLFVVGAIALIALGAVAWGMRNKMLARATVASAAEPDDHVSDEAAATLTAAAGAGDGDAVESADAPDADSDAEAADADAVAAPATRAPSSPARWVLLGVVAAVIGLAVFVTARGPAAQSAGAVLSRQFTAGESCANTAFTHTPANGADLTRDGEKIIDSLKTVKGIGLVKLDTSNGFIQIGYCESSGDEKSIAQALTASGLVQVAAAPNGAGTPATSTAPAPGK
jgi:hypothetical protein